MAVPTGRPPLPPSPGEPHRILICGAPERQASPLAASLQEPTPSPSPTLTDALPPVLIPSPSRRLIYSSPAQAPTWPVMAVPTGRPPLPPSPGEPHRILICGAPERQASPLAASLQAPIRLPSPTLTDALP